MFEKTLVLSIICSKTEDEKTFKEKESVEIFQLKIFNYLKNMVEENISQEFRLKNIDETRNYFLKEISNNEFYKWRVKKCLHNSKLY